MGGRRRAAGGRRQGGGVGGPKRSPTLFPTAQNKEPRFGVGVLLAIAEAAGGPGVVRFIRVESFHARPGRRPTAAILDRADASAAGRLFTGLAHRDRIRLARAIMTGANTHAALREAVNLKPGPLYHHLRELERSGLVERLERNGYAMTAAGRSVMLVAAVLAASQNNSHVRWRNERRPAR